MGSNIFALGSQATAAAASAALPPPPHRSGTSTPTASWSRCGATRARCSAPASPTTAGRSSPRRTTRRCGCGTGAGLSHRVPLGDGDGEQRLGSIHFHGCHGLFWNGPRIRCLGEWQKGRENPGNLLFDWFQKQLDYLITPLTSLINHSAPKQPAARGRSY